MTDDGAGSFPRRRCTASGICCSQVRAGRSISERSVPAAWSAVISVSQRASMTVPGIWSITGIAEAGSLARYARHVAGISSSKGALRARCRAESP